VPKQGTNGAFSVNNTLTTKVFPGGHLSLVGANSPAGLASRPIRVLLIDEVDRFPESVGSEGDPVQLAVNRTKTFNNRKIILTSTPTVKFESRIEKSFLESDQRYFWIPCSHCRRGTETYLGASKVGRQRL
jgi:phage terminase large subunit GpA-like protein